MTGEQRDKLERLRMKAASPEMVTVPRALLLRVLQTALIDSYEFEKLGENPTGEDDRYQIDALRKAAVIE